MARELVDVDLLHHGRKVHNLKTSANTNDADDLQKLLEDSVVGHRNSRKNIDYSEYQIKIYRQKGSRIDYTGRNT